MSPVDRVSLRTTMIQTTLNPKNLRTNSVCGRDDWKDLRVRDDDDCYLVDVGGEEARLKLLRCPVCGEDWTHEWDRAATPMDSHLKTHSPEDFGLEPLSNNAALADRGQRQLVADNGPGGDR